jgi:hypothetical protein
MAIVPFEQRFWSKVNKTDGCWLWTGADNGFGYGVIGEAFGKRKRIVYAHRYSYELHHGPIAPGLYVCHRCDVKRCVNPAHLFQGTAADNIHDMISKGRRRSYDRHGERNPRALMTVATVRQFRALRAEGWTLARLAQQFGIGTTQASRIARGEQWPEEVGEGNSDVIDATFEEA